MRLNIMSQNNDKPFTEMSRTELLEFIGINYLQYIDKHKDNVLKLSNEDLLEIAEEKNKKLEFLLTKVVALFRRPLKPKKVRKSRNFLV
mgnify:CR=1 FL=1